MEYDWEFLLNATAERANRSTVPILAKQFDTPAQHGTGTLVRVADDYFLVSAAHVLIPSIELKVPLFIAAENESLILLKQASAIYTPKFQDLIRDEDPFDLAVWKLDDETVSRLSRKRFLDQTDIRVDTDLTRGRYLVFGYPCAWSAPLEDAPKTIAQAPIAIHAGIYAGLTNFELYDSKYHILLGFSAGTAVNATGNSEPVPDSLEGISGCSIWKMFDEVCEPEEWNPSMAKVVAVQTGIHRGVIRGTKWPGVLTALVSKWPKLKRCFNLWFPDSTPSHSSSPAASSAQTASEPLGSTAGPC